MNRSVQIRPLVKSKAKRWRPNVNTVERSRIAARYQSTARELFPALRQRLLDSRPTVGWVVNGKRQTRAPRPGVAATPIYGAPTFRNHLDQNGVHR